VAIESLARLDVPEAAPRAARLLDDPDPAVRRAAAVAAGRLRAAECSQKLIELCRGPDLELRGICLDSLQKLRDPRAVPLAIAALEQVPTQRAALNYLADWGGAEQAEPVTKLALQSRSHEIVAASAAALASWESKAADLVVRGRLQQTIAQVQGASGVVLRWSVQGPLDVEAARRLVPTLLKERSSETAAARWILASSEDADARVDLPAADAASADLAWLAQSEVFAPEPSRVQFLASGSGTFQVWLNGRSIYSGDKPARYQSDSLRFEGELSQGTNRLLVQLNAEDAAARFHVRFRRLGSSAEHERLAQHLLSGTGNVERGREVFQAAEKSLCIKCHRLGEQGGRIGPDLSGVGSRFSRVHLIESILEPSRAIAPSFDTIVAALRDGRIVSGVKVAEDERMLTLGDDLGRTHEIAKADIDERQSQAKSTMPDGLEKRLTDRELLDLLTFLLAQKKVGSP
jgi:putative heme-binding domain-containing protein